MRGRKSVFQAVRAWLADGENRTHAFCTLRYLFPLLWAALLGLLGFFYNIRAGLAGRLSLWQLLFNTVKQGRQALLTESAVGAARGYYILLLTGAAVAILATLAALILSVIAAYTYFVATGKRRNREECRAAKILFRALFRGRVSLLLSNILLLVPALFPLYFCAVSNRHPGGGFITLGFDPVLTVSLVLACLLCALCLYLAKHEQGKYFDMFYIEPEDKRNDTATGEDDAEMTASPE